MGSGERSPRGPGQSPGRWSGVVELKHVADVVHRFWLQKRSTLQISQNSPPDFWPQCFTVGGYLTLWGLTRKTIKTVPGVATGQQSIGKYNVALNGAVKCVQCFFVTVRAGTAYREIWRPVNNFFARIIRLNCSEIPIVLSNLLYHYFFIELWRILILWLAKMPNGGMPVFTLIATGWRHCWHARG